MNTRLSSSRVLRTALLSISFALALARAFAVPAFPGAEGFGANSVGGRGGTVYHVTNLNDSGAGSFRDAVSVAGRTVVFDVGGIFRITGSPVVVRANITIAGQTAPGEGITMYGNRISFSDAHNTICRYIRFRQGIDGDSGSDGVGLASGHDLIFDHVSASWGRDETFSASGSGISLLTLQDCIIGQGLMIHSAGSLMETSGGISIFRSLYIDNWMRNPKIKGVNDFRNNVLYNWGGGGGYIPAGNSAGLSYANMIGNYFIAGPNSPSSPFSSGNANYNLYFSNNLEDMNTNGAADGVPVVASRFPTLTLVGSPFAYPGPIVSLTPQQALAHVIAYAGASRHRDHPDSYMLDELQSYGTDGALIFNESEIGGIGTVAGGLTPLDTDLDGMPDWWEQAAGTNPAVADNNGDINADGYTNLENYINSLVIAGVPVVTISGIANDSGSSSSDGVTSDNTLVLSGTAAPGATVSISRVDTGIIGSAIANGSGVWTFDYTGTVLPDRYYAFMAAIDLGGGNYSVPTAAFAVKVDTIPAAAPVITGLNISPSYAFSGTAEPFAVVTVTLIGVGPVGTTTANGIGNWNALYSGAPLAPGVYTFTAVASDLAGNVGPASSPYSVDTSIAPPAFTGITSDNGVSASDQLTNDNTLVLAGTGPASSTISVTRAGVGVIGTAPANAGGVWSFSYEGTVLPEGQHSFSASAATGGNSSPVSLPFVVTIDRTAPTISTINRLNPATAATTLSTLVYRVTFAEPVVNVGTTDFALVRAAGVTGDIASLAPVSSSVYDVTVTGASGDGTIRLDRAAGSTINDFAGNAGSTATFTGGQSYTMRLPGSGVWITTDSGGFWSDSSNWESGTIATGVGATADFASRDLSEDVTAILDTPRTLSRIVFGDTDPATVAAWTLTNNGVAGNTLTLAGTTPTIQVNAPSTPSTDTVDVPAANAYPTILDAVLAGTGGFTKLGVGTIHISQPATISGPLTVTKGIVQVGTGGSFSPSSVFLATSQQLRIVGGSFSTLGNVTWNSGTGTGIIVSGGTASFVDILPSNFRNSFVRVTGGTLTASRIIFPRSGDSEGQAVSAGIQISGGLSTVGTVGLGTADSWGALVMSDGIFNVTDTITVANQVTLGRGGVVNISGGEFNVTNSTAGKGLILSRNPGTQANNVSKLTITGGVSNIARITLGFDATSTAGSAAVTVSTGELNVGAGGIVKNGTAGMTTTVTLNSGVLGAIAPWSTTHPIVVGGTPASLALRAANSGGVPFDYTLGVVSGAGGFAKTGAGKVTLVGASSFGGSVAVNAGTLAIQGSLTSGTGVVDVNNGGTLAGTGPIAKPIALNAGGTVSPGIGGVGTLNAASLTWNGGGRIAHDIGASSDLLALSGALTKGSAGSYEFAFNPLAPVAVGNTYPLASFASSTFVGADFSATGIAPYSGDFTVTANALSFTVTSDGSGLAAFNAWMAPFGVPAGLNGPADDADGDGDGNLLEFILGQNPTTGGIDGIVLTKVTIGSDEYPALQFKRRIARGDVQVEVRASAALDSSNALGSVEVSATPQGDGTDLVIVRSATTLAAQPKQFLRLFVKLP